MNPSHDLRRQTKPARTPPTEPSPPSPGSAEPSPDRYAANRRQEAIEQLALRKIPATPDSIARMEAMLLAHGV